MHTLTLTPIIILLIQACDSTMVSETDSGLKDAALDAIDITATCTYWGGFCGPPGIGGCNAPGGWLPALPGNKGCPGPCGPADTVCHKSGMCCAPPLAMCSSTVYCYQGWECRGGPDPSQWCIPTPHDTSATYNCGKINCTNGCQCEYPYSSICDCAGVLPDAGPDAAGDASAAEAGDQ